METKNIILDLGGVILNIDYNKTIEAFKKLGIKNFQELYTQAQQSEVFDAFEKGLISADEFLDFLKNILPSTVERNQIIDAWNMMLLDLPKERLTFLTTLKQNYNLVLLSNTNTIHLDHFAKELKAKHQIDSLDSFFKKTYFSCNMGMRKPDQEIFKEVCKDSNFNPSETIFIDDSIQHVEGAKEAGIKAHHLNTEDLDIIQLLNSLLA
ncbi:HAD family hydrolase [Brumimicrobium salinarum]|nr:HAD family phosphatase [Brumimicrobium salinarum]